MRRCITRSRLEYRSRAGASQSNPTGAAGIGVRFTKAAKGPCKITSIAPGVSFPDPPSGVVVRLRWIMLRMKKATSGQARRVRTPDHYDWPLPEVKFDLCDDAFNERARRFENDLAIPFLSQGPVAQTKSVNVDDFIHEVNGRTVSVLSVAEVVQLILVSSSLCQT